MLEVLCSHTFKGHLYTRGLQPWHIEPHVTHFLDEIVGKPMGHGSRAFVHSVNPIWTKRMDHVHLFNEILFLFLKKNGNVVALIFNNSFFISSFLSHSISFVYLFVCFVFVSFFIFHKQSQIMDQKRSKHLL
jgi:hypothetical protein